MNPSILIILTRRGSSLYPATVLVSWSAAAPTPLWMNESYARVFPTATIVGGLNGKRSARLTELVMSDG